MRRKSLMIRESMDFVAAHDKEVGDAIKKEWLRQKNNLELMGSKNIV